jgi:hypothetical protein
MLTYNPLITMYFTYLGVRGESVGNFLWPAVAIHAGLSVLLIRARFHGRRYS